jgi:DNA-directed RNA polymerase specialized sigma subunit
LDEPASVERLWEEFKLKASADAPERLILHYAPLVKYVAGRVSVGLPPNIEQADLVSYGIFGLIDAIEKSLDDKGAEDPVAVFESQEMKGILAGATTGSASARRS